MNTITYSIDCTDHSTAANALRDYRTTDLARAKIKAEEYAERGAVGVSGFDAEGNNVLVEALAPTGWNVV